MDDRQELRVGSARALGRRILKTPAWRAGFALLALVSASVYVTALELDALLSQVLAAFATGGAVMATFGRHTL